MIACVVVVGLSTSSGSAFAVGSPRASTVSPTFCQSASDAFTSTANVLPATVVSSSISAQYVILLDNAVGAYTRLVAQTPSSGPKSAYQRAVTSFKRALGDERSAHSTSSPSAQRAAADQYRAGLAALVGASSLPYRSCVGLKIVIGETIASSLSWDAIKAAAASHRVVTTSDLRHSAAAVDGAPARRAVRSNDYVVPCAGRADRASRSWPKSVRARKASNSSAVIGVAMKYP